MTETGIFDDGVKRTLLDVSTCMHWNRHGLLSFRRHKVVTALNTHDTITVMLQYTNYLSAINRGKFF